MPLPEAPATGKIPFEPPSGGPPELKPFWKLWREERFWACHEALEEVWKAETDVARRRFLQGLLHCAVAVFQHRRGNARGAARQWLRARTRLAPFRPYHEQLDLETMLAGVESEIETSLIQEPGEMDRLRAELATKLASGNP